MKKQEKVIVYRNEAPIEELRSKLEAALPEVQKAFDEWQKTPFYSESVTLRDLFTNIDAVKHSYKKSLIADELISSKLKLKEDQAANLYEIPWTGQFDTALSKAKGALTSNSLTIDHYTQGKKGVEINQDIFQNFVDKNSIYASSPEEKALFQHFNKFLTETLALNEFLKKKTNAKLLMRNNIILGQFFTLTGTGEYVINHRTFKNLIAQMK